LVKVNVRPGSDMTALGWLLLGAPAVAVLLALKGIGGDLNLLFVLLLGAGALLCLRPRSYSQGDWFVMRGAVRTRKVERAEIERFEMGGDPFERHHVVAVMRDGRRYRVPGTMRPVDMRLRWYQSTRYKPGAEELQTRLHLWKSTG
jgi:hypothetical protein